MPTCLPLQVKPKKCCLSVFQSAEDGKISYRDALIYTAKRTNRQESSSMLLVCCDDMNQDKVKRRTSKDLRLDVVAAVCCLGWFQRGCSVRYGKDNTSCGR